MASASSSRVSHFFSAPLSMRGSSQNESRCSSVSYTHLTGCGASLDREVTVQDMTFKVPKTWLESPSGNGTSGTVVFTEDNEDLDEDETGNSLTISYKKLAATPAAAVVEEAVEELSLIHI